MQSLNTGASKFFVEFHEKCLIVDAACYLTNIA